MGVASLRLGRNSEYRLLYRGETKTRPEDIISDEPGRVYEDPGGDVLDIFQCLVLSLHVN